jgi:hypothetical protein
MDDEDVREPSKPSDQNQQSLFDVLGILTDDGLVCIRDLSEENWSRQES